jgi:hypothetical protein
MYGFAIGALDGYGPSPLAYWQSLLSPESALRLPVSVAFSTLSTLIAYSAAFGLARVLTSDRSVRSMSSNSIGWRLALFAAFVVVGGLVTQTLPLMLSAMPIFDRFPNIARHDALPLLLADFADSATSIIACTATGTLCAMAANGDRIGLWYALGAIVMLAGQVEPLLLPQTTFGLASFVVGTILIARPLWKAIGLARNAPMTTVAMAVAAAAVIAGSWFGLGGPGCVAVSLEAASASASKAGDAGRAIDLEKLATRFAPLNATGFLALARLQLASPTFSRDSIASSERALRAPFLHYWNERFDILVTAATSHLERRDPSDWSLAASQLAAARDLWRRNTRLDPQTGVALYYGSAVVACHEGADPISALGYVVAAIGFIADEKKAIETARTAINDDDLACVSLFDMTRPASSTIEFFRGVRGTTENAIDQALSHGIDRQEAARFLRLLIRSRAEELAIR